MARAYGSTDDWSNAVRVIILGVDERQHRAVEVLRGEASLPGLLHAATREFVNVVDGEACAISRVVGHVLIQVAEHARDGRTLVLGHGYLISDFPLTDAALTNNEPHCVSTTDRDADPREAALLEELGFDSLLMLPLVEPGGPWGLAEIYVNGRSFGQDDVAAARPLAEAFGEQLAVLPAAASTR
jgi:GAF domain